MCGRVPSTWVSPHRRLRRTHLHSSEDFTVLHSGGPSAFWGGGYHREMGDLEDQPASLPTPSQLRRAKGCILPGVRSGGWEISSEKSWCLLGLNIWAVIL